MSNSLGSQFRIHSFGESHGNAIGVVIDGCPAGYTIDLEKIQEQLDRRRPGQSHLATPRNEADRVRCLSGIADNISLGTPITLVIENKNQRPSDYKQINQIYRPSHADYTTQIKYGVRPQTGGGRASARETAARVAAGALAEQILNILIPELKIVAYVERVGDIKANITDPIALNRSEVEKHLTRCPDSESSKKMEELIVKMKKQGDSIGGQIFCGISGCPAGLGEPVFDKLEADLAKAMMSLPASKGFEIGSGFAGSYLKGSEHNDQFCVKNGKVSTTSNFSGGIQGGISNGEFIYMRVAFKPVATIFKEQKSIDSSGKQVALKPRTGRHDPCVLPRAVPIVESMASLVICDHFFRQLHFKEACGPLGVKKT